MTETRDDPQKDIKPLGKTLTQVLERERERGRGRRKYRLRADSCSHLDMLLRIAKINVIKPYPVSHATTEARSVLLRGQSVVNGDSKTPVESGRHRLSPPFSLSLSSPLFSESLPPQPSTPVSPFRPLDSFLSLVFTLTCTLGQ